MEFSTALIILTKTDLAESLAPASLNRSRTSLRVSFRDATSWEIA